MGRLGAGWGGLGRGGARWSLVGSLGNWPVTLFVRRRPPARLPAVPCVHHPHPPPCRPRAWPPWGLGYGLRCQRTHSPPSSPPLPSTSPPPSPLLRLAPSAGVGAGQRQVRAVPGPQARGQGLVARTALGRGRLCGGAHGHAHRAPLQPPGQLQRCVGVWVFGWWCGWWCGWRGASEASAWGVRQSWRGRRAGAVNGADPKGTGHLWRRACTSRDVEQRRNISLRAWLSALLLGSLTVSYLVAPVSASTCVGG